ANVNAKESGRGETALMFAAANNRPAAIKVLMEHRADPSMATTVLDVAAKTAAARGAAPPAQPQQGQGRGNGGNGNGGNGNMDEERPLKIDTMGGLTPLLLAARQGHIDAARALIDAGANINEVSPGDKTS